jgi:hypothetical protein
VKERAMIRQNLERLRAHQNNVHRYQNSGDTPSP